MLMPEGRAFQSDRLAMAKVGLSRRDGIDQWALVVAGRVVAVLSQRLSTTSDAILTMLTATRAVPVDRVAVLVGLG